jgi:hypothetical protein
MPLRDPGNVSKPAVIRHMSSHVNDVDKHDESKSANAASVSFSLLGSNDISKSFPGHGFTFPKSDVFRACSMIEIVIGLQTETEMNSFMFLTFFGVAMRLNMSQAKSELDRSLGNKLGITSIPGSSCRRSVAGFLWKRK